jgi:hypothetical protein
VPGELGSRPACAVARYGERLHHQTWDGIAPGARQVVSRELASQFKSLGDLKEVLGQQPDLATGLSLFL